MVGLASKMLVDSQFFSGSEFWPPFRTVPDCAQVEMSTNKLLIYYWNSWLLCAFLGQSYSWRMLVWYRNPLVSHQLPIKMSWECTPKWDRVDDLSHWTTHQWCFTMVEPQNHQTIKSPWHPRTFRLEVRDRNIFCRLWRQALESASASRPRSHCQIIQVSEPYFCVVSTMMTWGSPHFLETPHELLWNHNFRINSVQKAGQGPWLMKLKGNVLDDCGCHSVVTTVVMTQKKIPLGFGHKLSGFSR